MAKQNTSKLKDNKRTMIIALVGAVVVFGAVGAWLLASSSAVAKCVKNPPIEKRGSSGRCVRIVQEMLNLTNGAGLAVDGSFGPKTEAAVRAFQAKTGIKQDGQVGLETWGRLCPANASSPGSGKQTTERNIERYSQLKTEAGCGG
ncbi:MAG TPA: peptidoglycan-binding domain-containing protein [Candidatus Saccharimonadales bacterium]|nr:peptidoglycan-binding domain-containing protein [Candidatus Saccharimonadales bacterium]